MNRSLQIAQKIVSTVFRLWPQPRPSHVALHTVKIVAHRGLHEDNSALENTLESFRLATDCGIWGIEFDVRFTRDNIPVVHHDPACGRLFQRDDLEIATIDFARLRKEIPQIPSLAEVVEAAGNRLHLMIEIKEDLRARPQCVPVLGAAVAALRPTEDFHILCIQPDYLQALTVLPKSAFMGVIVHDRAYTMRRNQELGHGAISGHFLHFTAQDIQAYHAQTKPVGVGFIDSRNSLYREINRGVDFIFTNHPRRLKSFLLELAASKSRSP